MTFSYDVNALDEPLYRIRLELGDTDSDRVLLQDAEIEQVISEQSVFEQRVVMCCKLIMAKFARHPEKLVLEGYEETTLEIYNRYKEMATEWAAKSGYPWAGSIESDFKSATELDTTLVSSKFKLGMHDNG